MLNKLRIWLIYRLLKEHEKRIVVEYAETYLENFRNEMIHHIAMKEMESRKQVH